MKTKPFAHKFHALICLLLFSLHSAALGEERIALLVGNNIYPEEGLFPTLDNAENDVKLVAKALQKAGFETIVVTNASRAEMRMKLVEFESRIKPGGTALFYFAGHGIQFEGENYLMGSNALLEKKYELGDEAIRAKVVLDAMVDKRPKSSFVFLDCCRSHPPKSWLESNKRSARTQGLASMEAPGMVISYSAAPGQPAADGGGKNSPFASSLAANILKPQEFDRILKAVGRHVYNVTNAEQQTWRSGSLHHDFYFTQASANATPPLASGSTDKHGPPVSIPDKGPSAIPGGAGTMPVAASGNIESSSVVDFKETDPITLPSSGYFTNDSVFETGQYEDYNWYAKRYILKKAQAAIPAAGSADGKMGKKTQTALISFQESHSLPVTGRLDDRTLSTMKLTGIEEVSAPAKSSSKRRGRSSGQSSGRNSGNFNHQKFRRNAETAARIYRIIR